MKPPIPPALLESILALALLASCAPTTPADSPALAAIDRFCNALALPELPPELVEKGGMVNSPSGRLQVLVYQDPDGRKFSVDLETNRVVEMDARSLLPPHGSSRDGAPRLGADTLRALARKYMSAVIPDFDALEARWRYEEGNKGDNYFFTWYGDMPAGTMNRPFAQLGIHDSGLVFAFYNTLLLEN